MLRKLKERNEGTQNYEQNRRGKKKKNPLEILEVKNMVIEIKKKTTTTSKDRIMSRLDIGRELMNYRISTEEFSQNLAYREKKIGRYCRTWRKDQGAMMCSEESLRLWRSNI